MGRKTMRKRRSIPFTNPATGEQFGEVEVRTPEDVCQAMHQMREAQPVWSNTPLYKRIRVMREFKQIMIDQVDELSEVITCDTGKSRQDAMIEVFMVVDLLSYQLSKAPTWLRRERVTSRYFVFKKSYIERRPFGVVGVIAPWNYPFALSMPPVLAALLTGNTVLLKPSEVTAATGVMIEKLFERCPKLAGYIRVLHGDAETGAALVDAHPDYIFLTGSTKTGQMVMRKAAEKLIPVACELGGKDPMIVLEDADLDSAARWGVWGALYNSGQTCMSVERVYVVEKVYQQFVQKALDELRRLKVGYTADIDNHFYMGPITDPRQVAIIDRHLEDARQKGARLLSGGGRRQMFVEPVLLTEVDHSMLLMKEETFGPLLPVVSVKDEAEAIRLANDSDFGLSASIWSQDLRRAERVARQLQGGSVVVNDTIAHFAVSSLPFGGTKQSGTGRIHGREGLMQFTHSYSYLVGKPPKPYDFVTIMRNPGNYQAGKVMLRLLFGITLKKRLDSVLELFGLSSKKTRRSC
jgi:acyl-CoA reductase-like NAD-dependent aldehyde dehydrogenase